MESFNQRLLSTDEREILQYLTFKLIPCQHSSYYRYAYGYGYSYGYSYEKRKFNESEFDRAVDSFEEKGWVLTLLTFNKKGEIESRAQYLHPIIWLDVLQSSKTSKYYKLDSSDWGKYQLKTMHVLLGDAKEDYIRSVASAIDYEEFQPLGTYLVWSLFSDQFNKVWLKEFARRMSYLEWQALQLSYCVKMAASLAFIYYKQPDVETFKQYAPKLFEDGSYNQEEVEDCIRENWDFVINGSGHDVLAKCYEDTDGSSWIYAAGLLRQKDYKKAFQWAKSASRQKGWATAYKSALEDLVYGLALYHNRETASALKKIKEFDTYFSNLTSDYEGSINLGTKLNVCTILLAHLCLHPITSSELETIWSNFCSDVEDVDRRAFFGLLMGYLGIENAVHTVDTILRNLPTYSYLIESELYSIKKKLDLVVETGEPEVDESKLFLPIINGIEIKKDWEIALDQLSFLNIGAKTAASRVIYLFDNWEIAIRQQKNGRNGWGAFTALSWKSFIQGLPFMDDVDRQIAAIASTPNLDNPDLEILKKLVDSNRVYDALDPSTRLSIEEVKLEIVAKKNKDGSYTFSTNVPLENSDEAGNTYASNGLWWNIGNTYYCKENNTIKICQLTDEQRKITEILLKVPKFPDSVKPNLTRVLEAVSRTTTVMSDLLEGAQNLPTIKGLTELTVRIKPEEDYFDVKALQCLVENTDITCKPGIGLSNISGTVEGKNVRIERDLKKEKENYQKFLEATSPFDSWQYEDGSWQLDLPDMLEMLEVLRNLGTSVRIEWPEGAEYKVKKPVRNFKDFSLTLRGSQYWLDINGKLKVDEKVEYEMSEILKKIHEAKGRFIRLEGNEFIALNEKLMKQLQTLEEISSKKGKGLSMSRYSVGFIKSLQSEGAEVDSDGSYEDLVDRIEKASDIQVALPKSFTGQLRTYQEEGFEWMTRLASWEAGGILADDMGLGKTVQAIALLGEKKKDGPSLVVCPSAVLINWEHELKRFDPSLNIRLFNKEDRDAVLKEAKAGDVVLSTYGVLTSEIEKVSKVKWNVVILDEAHSIKNKATLTAKSVKQLNANARFLLTGTPIQNHLGEIWNLMEFANPGLLGSFNAFAERFIYPIEKRQDKDRQKLLRNMIAPFILRRTKEEVEQELPPRTEVEIKVTLSEAEKALYQELNQRALDDIESGRQDSAISILAHLTKLRQAACHPELVDPKLKIGSSKTTAFLSLAQRLISEGHRALVFSQFTSHLALIKKELDALGIPYLYMDGSNTPSERDKLKKAFQEGTAPLFLISLKAGGIGMNLTAADYVIHLDPWWNPAIEDQASDRAHRIGQDKPVYIYKLISEGTIEEKILGVHKTKKSLADALLEGSDVSARFSKDEILDILKASETLRN